jgi:hypothetical protein
VIRSTDCGDRHLDPIDTPAGNVWRRDRKRQQLDCLRTCTASYRNMDWPSSQIARQEFPGAQKMASVSEMALFSITTVASAHLLWRYVWQVTELFRLQLPTAGKGCWPRIFGQPLRCSTVHDAWVGTLSKLARQRLRILLAPQLRVSKSALRLRRLWRHAARKWKSETFADAAASLLRFIVDVYNATRLHRRSATLRLSSANNSSSGSRVNLKQPRRSASRVHAPSTCALEPYCVGVPCPGLL